MRGYLNQALFAIVLVALVIPTAVAQYAVDRSAARNTAEFAWPDGFRGAVSLTFDDARASQLDIGLPILDRHGVKATFYVSSDGFQERLSDWRKAVAGGHEIGNHSFTHPCTGNYPFARNKALENYSLATMAADIDRATELIERLLGTKPLTFAYPCGQKFVGRGEAVKSYAPLVAERFIAGRGWLDENSNDPAFCDPAQLLAMELDGLEFDRIKNLADRAADESRWLVLTGHDIGPAGRQTVIAAALDRFCRYAADPDNGIWIDTVKNVAQHVLEERGSSEIR